jgi:hypothetical protein
MKGVCERTWCGWLLPSAAILPLVMCLPALRAENLAEVPDPAKTSLVPANDHLLAVMFFPGGGMSSGSTNTGGGGEENGGSSGNGGGTGTSSGGGPTGSPSGGHLPEPATLLSGLVGTSLVGLYATYRRKREGKRRLASAA